MNNSVEKVNFVRALVGEPEYIKPIIYKHEILFKNYLFPIIRYIRAPKYQEKTSKVGQNQNLEFNKT